MGKLQYYVDNFEYDNMEIYLRAILSVACELSTSTGEPIYSYPLAP